MLHFTNLFGRKRSDNGAAAVIDASLPEEIPAGSSPAMTDPDPLPRDAVAVPSPETLPPAHVVMDVAEAPPAQAMTDVAEAPPDTLPPAHTVTDVAMPSPDTLLPAHTVTDVAEAPPDTLPPAHAVTDTDPAPASFAMRISEVTGEVLVPAAAVSPLSARLVGIAAVPTFRDEAIPDPDPIVDRWTVPQVIGGAEADLVPVIPDTSVDYQPPDHAPDDESSAQAAIEALAVASRVFVERVKQLRHVPEPIAVVAGLIDLVNELQARYLEDSGIVRDNSLDEVLRAVRETLSEGDRFILESLEGRRGRLTASTFVEDMRTIAPSDHLRLIVHYVVFLIFLAQHVLRQYLRPLEGNPARLQTVDRRLEHLVDGAREALLATVDPAPR